MERGRFHLQRAQAVRFQQMAKPEDDAHIVQATRSGVQAGALTVQRDIVLGFFRNRVQQAKPLLQKVHAQLMGNCQGRPACLASGRVWLDQSNQLGQPHKNPRFRVRLVTSSNPLLATLSCFTGVQRQASLRG